MAQLTCLSFVTLQETTGEAESVRGPNFVKVIFHHRRPVVCVASRTFQSLFKMDSTRSCTVAILRSNVSAYCTCRRGVFHLK